MAWLPLLCTSHPVSSVSGCVCLYSSSSSSLFPDPTSCVAVDHSAFNHTKSQQIHLLTVYKYPTTSSALTHVGLSPHFLRATHHLFYKICNCKFFLGTFESSILSQQSASFPTQKYFS